MALEESRARDFHTLLVESHTGLATVEPFEQWWRNVRDDTEFDPELCLAVWEPSGQLVAGALCWSSGFIKDLVVARRARRQGIGRALLQHLFGLLSERGLCVADLKVERNNPHGAVALYRAVGFEPIPERDSA